jgi:orotidine-5'-phosphate decarboxylase
MTEAQTAHTQPIPATDRPIIALFVSSAGEARIVVSQTADLAGAFKIGLQLFSAAGPELVREFCEAGHKIFLDLKFHDIPNTVAKAAVEATRMGVWMFNVHASGGNEMLRQTVSMVGEYCQKSGLTRPKIIAVTVLTSSADDVLKEIGIEAPASTHAANLAKLARTAGMDGVVASAKEASQVRELCGSQFLIVTPGIRPAGASNDDQRRVMTPADAIRAGSDHLVVGRPVTEAENIARAAENILNEIESVVNES